VLDCDQRKGHLAATDVFFNCKDQFAHHVLLFCYVLIITRKRLNFAEEKTLVASWLTCRRGQVW
jgi:hypothetical protein